MHTIKSKLRPCNYWRIGEHESWFSDMALEGLQLYSIGRNFANFIKGEPKRMRYRIELVQDKNITMKQKLMFAQDGWDYVTSYGEFNVFSSPIEVYVSEIHSANYSNNDFTLKYLNKKFIKMVASFILIVLVFLGMIAASSYLISTPFLNLIQGKFYSISSEMLLLIYIYGILKEAIAIGILRTTVASGEPIDHAAPWKRKRRFYIMEFWIVVGLILLAMFSHLIITGSEKTKIQRIGDTNFPIIRLADLEQNFNLLPDSSILGEDVDWVISYSNYWSILSSMQLDTVENGIVEDEIWKDNSGTYTPSIVTTMYKLRFSSMSEALLTDLIKYYSILDGAEELKEIEHPSFDKLLVYEGEHNKELFAVKGEGVICIRYYGYADVNSLIEATAEKISLIAN